MGIQDELIKFYREKGMKRGIKKALQIIDLLNEGKSIAEISEKLDTSIEFVEELKAAIKQ